MVSITPHGLQRVRIGSSPLSIELTTQRVIVDEEKRNVKAMERKTINN